MTLTLSTGLVGLALLVSAAGLLGRGATRTSAVLMALAGSALLVGAVVAVGDLAADPGAATTAQRAAFLVLLPLALATYPRVGHHVADGAALLLVAGGGASGVLWDDDRVADLAGVWVCVVLVAHTWWRLENSTATDRRALTWMAVALGVAGAVVFVAAFGPAEDAGLAAGVLALGLLGPACVVGVRLPEILDVRGLVVTLVVGAVSVAVHVAVWVLFVAVLAAAGLRDPSLGMLGLLGAVAALGMHPVQRLLRASVDAVLFGARPDPLGAASLVVHGMGEDPQQALDGIRDVLVLPWVALRRPDGSTLASGEPVPYVRTVVLPDDAGELLVGLRAGDLRLTAEDRRVLGIVAPLLALLVRATDLGADLARSRAATVTALEEERRRLRRDLHDGLGPRLSGIAFTTDAARNLLRTAPDRADALLRGVRADTTAAIDDVRGLVYGMRPPALDELGLVPSLRQHAETLRDRSGRSVAVDVTAHGVPSRLPAAVEVAAYRIVTEALANVARHSDSPTAAVRITGAPQALEVEVVDRGRARAAVGETGQATGWRAGVGLVSMRERAEEVGGTVVAGPADHGGRVRAVLPYAPS